jgi:hypothetical protein
MGPHSILSNFQFPVSTRVHTLILCLSANGNSSYRDAVSVAGLMSERFGSTVSILSDRALTSTVPMGTAVHILKDKSDCLDKINTYIRGLPSGAELLFVLSAHGYSKRATKTRCGKELNDRSEYVLLQGVPIFDYELFTSLYGKMSPDTRSLCLIDTCHSGTMLDLEYLSSDGGAQFRRSWTPLTKRPLSVCISACDDDELAGEDISTYGGWGGKLVCQYLDYVSAQKTPGPLNVLAFHNSVFRTFTQQASQRSRPILSYNM